MVLFVIFHSMQGHSVYTCTHACTCTCTHAHARVHMHTHICTYASARMHMHTRTSTHMHINTLMHTHARTCTLCKHMHAHAHYANTCMYKHLNYSKSWVYSPFFLFSVISFHISFPSLLLLIFYTNMYQIPMFLFVFMV